MVFVLTFAAIALVVAGLVIANTFQVLVAQRTRTLALLRAVGASKRQVGQSVLVEAAALGLAASALGVLAGCGLGQTALSIARRSEAAVFMPATINVTWQVVVAPLLAGVAVTVLAALAPALAATRVAPLAAMRPDDGPAADKRTSGRVRLVASLLAVVAGLALLGLGAWLGTARAEVNSGLVAGVTGGTISFVGVAVSAVYWLPHVASWSGHLIGLTGPTAQLAAANTRRNPRRTTATSTALLIGVTLVTTMSTGAANARASLDGVLDKRYPIDLLVQSSGYELDGALTALPPDVVAAVRRTNAVTAMVQPLDATLTLAGATAIGRDPADITAMGIDPAAGQTTLTDDSIIAGLAPGVVVVPPSQAKAWRITAGDDVTLSGPDGTITLTAAVAGEDGPGAWILDPADLNVVAAQTASSQMWASLRNGADDVAAIQDAISETGKAVVVAGVAVQRESFQDVIDTVLGAVLGLLAVAVVIALIGVANTLSLSVFERRRESATLRAIGVTRGQLRRMVAVEGMLISGVGAALGITTGLLYGWCGAMAALGALGDVRFETPWRDIALTIVIALVAGLVASVLPGRSAAKPSPVEALATE
ncbi:FtsX-like permease family protein [Xylanimonas allomyrinae]|uniref:FtsX-like permease family protein n=1 Tax=Xylanimonas allomyrinae TaxID=2509459 RepID=UPI001FE3D7F0|nr:FtsX-like permease family protein [Xylanimonas allomyrinae]